VVPTQPRKQDIRLNAASLDRQLALRLFSGPMPDPVEKLRAISTELAVGLAGDGDDFNAVAAGLVNEPATDWATLDAASRKIVTGINGPKEDKSKHASLVIAGTVGGERGMFACGPASVMGGADAAGRPTFACAGTGGLRASIAVVEALWSQSLAGEELLEVIVREATRTDPQYTAGPFYRFDLREEVSGRLRYGSRSDLLATVHPVVPDHLEQGQGRQVERSPRFWPSR
jgi:hypothetical protein